MSAKFVLLRCIGKAVVKNVANLFTFGIGGDILVDMWDYWREASTEEQRAADVQALAVSPPADVAIAAADIVLDLGAQLSDAGRQTVNEYLRQVPEMIRRSQRRPADPEGKTVPPGATFKKPEDLLRLLPTKAPRFKKGDRPEGLGDRELAELLGVGGFGEVWKAFNPQVAALAPVALKFCLDPATAKNLRHEAVLLGRVMQQGQHPGIVRLIHTYLGAEPPCLEYEFVEGGDLAGLIHELHQVRAITPQRAAMVILRLAGIVGYAHQLNPAIVHRDLKPANILVQQTKENKYLFKVADFGIGGLAASQTLAESRGEATKGLMAATIAQGSCTPLYASPQQRAGQPADPRDDVYALGVIWHQLLTGDLSQGRPGGAGWLKRLVEKGMSPVMGQLLESCFEDDPEDRPATAAVLAERLAPLVLPPLPPPSPPPKPPRPIFSNSVGMTFTQIPAGTFLMGSPESESGRQACEGPQHGVTISRPFHLGIHAVTQRQYEAVMGCNPSLFAGNPDHPVERVSWQDAVEFCTRLSARAPELQAARTYRLPTEAEWEFACRAGTTTPFHFGSSASSQEANFDGSYPYGGASKGPPRKRTSKTGSHPANAWGLYDMHGNVREWCADWFAEDYYRKRENKDPQGPPTGDLRVLRGGSWGSKGKNCRCAYREGAASGSRNNSGFGFRVVCLIAARMQ